MSETAATTPGRLFTNGFTVLAGAYGLCLGLAMPLLNAIMFGYCTQARRVSSTTGITNWSTQIRSSRRSTPPRRARGPRKVVSIQNASHE